MEVAVLDIAQDSPDQGFRRWQFDLLIANGDINQTPESVLESIRHVRALTKHSERLLFQLSRE